MELSELLQRLNFTVTYGVGGISNNKKMAYAEGFLDCLQFLDKINSIDYNNLLIDKEKSILFKVRSN